MSEMGERIIAGLKEFADALESGVDITEVFRCTTLTRAQAIGHLRDKLRGSLADMDDAERRKSKYMSMLKQLGLKDIWYDE